jgi:hypothetical protein
MSVIDRIDRRLANMKMMLELLGIDPAAFSTQDQGRFLAAALPACQACSCDERCGEWLMEAPAGMRQAPGFCPNAQIFAWAREDRLRNGPA